MLEKVAEASGKEMVEEQGFTGIRFEEPNKGGAFVGRGHLVIGVGAGLTESVLATLATAGCGNFAHRLGNSGPGQRVAAAGRWPGVSSHRYESLRQNNPPGV